MPLNKDLKLGPDDEIHGCIVAGKEANVYRATKSGQEVAISLSRSTGHLFWISSRGSDRYVQGDRRYKTGYCKHNPREMVKVWAEKEERNLNR
ncbi:uncharacterized protein LOC126786048 [Argentina anserina]|uniref:uncharacterized protein LOC126786048 n=1 Tax=Argentina anserina TaxID=57926 RepID=UPI0021767851|nr:uncharacterized protein LOC126786048 [Potentilla anserina]